MLVLSRKRDQSIKIGPISIMVVELRGDKVRLGFQAPRSIGVVRTEIESEEPFNPRQYTKDVLALLAFQLGLNNVEQKIDKIADHVLEMLK